MQSTPAHQSASGRHRPRPLDPSAKRPARLTDRYRDEHPGRLRAIGRRETRPEREKRARRVAARDRFLADVNRGSGRPSVVTA